LYAVSDYAFIELVTLAQTCLDRYGQSKLAEAINAGLDPHLDMAASLLGISYADAKRRADEPAIKAARQAAKAYNFGFPGGLGPAKMVDYARIAYGIEMTPEEAKKRREDWYDKWPEMRRYHADIGRACENEERETTVVQDVSGRVRGGCNFTAASNSYFQGRTADGAKRAGWYLARECYLADPYPNDQKHVAMGLSLRDGRRCSSPLFGCRTVAFVHDEFIVEAPRAVAPQAAKRLGDVMILGMREYVPQVTVKVETVLVERWYKGAKPVHDANGNLAVWRP
jgi:DNA polymerase-1